MDTEQEKKEGQKYEEQGHEEQGHEEQKPREQKPNEQKLGEQKPEEQKQKPEEQKPGYLDMANDIFDKTLSSFDNSDKNVTIKKVVFNFKNINDHGVILGNDAKIDNIQFGSAGKENPDKKTEVILADERHFNKWLSENYGTYSMALLVATAVFDEMPYTWVVRATEAFYQRFDSKKEEEEKAYGLSEMLEQFGAVICKGELNTYTGKVQIEVVKLAEKEYPDTVLRYIWKECPRLHDDIMYWLESYFFQNKVSMSKRAAQVMGKLICWDYYYFLDHMVKRIPLENDIATDMVIAQNLLILNKEKIYRENVSHLLYSWSREKHIHYLLTALLVCAELKNQTDILENIISAYVPRAVKEISSQDEGEYMQNMTEFFAAGVRAFTFYRILVENIYKQINSSLPGRAKDACKLFMGLFAVDLGMVQSQAGEDAIFIKLCMTTQEVSDQLCQIWQYIWQSRKYRQVFYKMMAQYVRKTGKNGGTRLEKFIDRAFGKICPKEVREDICIKIYRRAHYE